MNAGGNKRRTRTRRAVVAVVAIAALLVVALGAAIGALNREVYSASGFVRQYLEAVARADTVGALSLPGVTSDAKPSADGQPEELPTTLLRGSVLSPLDDIRLVSDIETAPGLHTVTYAFQLGSTPSTMDFTVRSTGTFAAVFNSWRFEESPLGSLEVNVLHESKFTVNGLTLDTRAHAAPDAPVAFANQASYQVFAPNLYTIGHESVLLSAPEQTVPVTTSEPTPVSVNAEPNATFVSQVQSEVNKFLDTCATQEVLQPSDCPFGIVIDDRIKSAPEWSIAEYPLVTLASGETHFEMPDTEGTAHIVVDVQSLFDGDLSTRDEDVTFAIGLSVGIRQDGSIAIQVH